MRSTSRRISCSKTSPRAGRTRSGLTAMQAPPTGEQPGDITVALVTREPSTLVWRHNWQTRREGALFPSHGLQANHCRATKYINGFYCPRRKHAALGWKSPVAFEQRAAEHGLTGTEPVQVHGACDGASWLPTTSGRRPTRRRGRGGAGVAPVYPASSSSPCRHQAATVSSVAGRASDSPLAKSR